ncbi:MAG: CusA/CzcA family heavy metal efflux RND transporter [Bacteroidales bacterium]|nr:CusA/CzcA family heavy metal efflux RND transporter [Bacteroidales bacterium]
MISKIIRFSVNNKLLIILTTLTIAAFGIYSITQIPLGAVPDITNNQVQVITTSPNLSTQDVEQFITYPIELEMSNLPGIKEIRSISKFGISLVTLVFDDDIGTYLPRQLISEKLNTVSEKIPEGFGKPSMGPITTGLGEIYQYILDVKPGYENNYSATDLRTLQDWYIRRQLAGISGVVEINSWGGYLKQYEIAVNPEKLKALNVSLIDVYNALYANNSVAGGAYIEKNDQSYFIRGDGLIKNIDEILKIVIKTNQSIPILLSDVAEVRQGYATRFGAITANGQGEKVLGQIMMLKGANSNLVINEVKNRVAEIQKHLPEGVFINPINDRSELIAKTTFTVLENLVFGSIIVFLIVFLLLGNIRSSIVISSLIPLALLFTISIMYLVGIDVNLMSLGALDFGVIIDGAVIIVEYIMVQLWLQKDQYFASQSDLERKRILNAVSYDSTSKMMNSAIFGQIIVLIVFIPIYVLSGVEGKMFKPMAMSFSFALVGAIFFGFTWVPVISSIFLKPIKKQKITFSDRLVAFVHRMYEPVLAWSYRHKLLVWLTAIASLVFTYFLFINMGGEFVPTLDEGDFVIQPVIKSGTSLSKTINLTTQMEQILLKQFPNEVDKIVSRIGAAEVPTDPMGMEEVDMIIKLKPKSEWEITDNKEELANYFKKALSVIPGIDYEFTQPIEMRFNELITGVRSDLAIKIFGEDIERLNQLALKVKSLIKDVPGAADISIEKTVGLPQMLVRYKREKLAHYGVNIKDLNYILSTAFGGAISGSYFEGEKRFDIVVKLPFEYRQDIEDIRMLPVPIANDKMVPLSELADIDYYSGPAKISRENTHRRIVVNVNVRNRDLQSVVVDIQKILSSNLKVPPGYNIQYGGQFENLQNALNRLMYAVPIALLLIFIFIHFALRSLKKAAMVFLAVPLATVGGVTLLWLRGMPFSISAGIGFIALFGIAVMNGIVLIEHMDELEHQGVKDIKERVFRAVKDRLRPVMLTASAAALGFLPMAISSSAGAEVQRPLATVVIGGLITSTMLTLIALPLLYAFLESIESIRWFPFKIIRKSSLPIILFVLLFSNMNSFAQNKTLTLDEAIKRSIDNAIQLKSSEQQVFSAKALKRNVLDIDKTKIYTEFDENNISANGHPLQVYGIEQSFKFPTYYWAQKKWYNTHYQLYQLKYEKQRRFIETHVTLLYRKIQIFEEKKKFLKEIDSLFTNYQNLLSKSFEQGNSSKLDLLNFQLKKTMLQSENKNTEAMYHQLHKELSWYVGDSVFTVEPFNEINLTILSDSVLALNNKQLELNKELIFNELKIEKNKLLPDITFQYFSGSNAYEPQKRYMGYQMGLSIPLFWGNQSSKIKALKLNTEAYNLFVQYKRSEQVMKLKQMNEQILKQLSLVNEFKKALDDNAMLLLELLNKNLKSGNSDYFKWIQSIENIVSLKKEYYQALIDLYVNYYEFIQMNYED